MIQYVVPQLCKCLGTRFGRKKLSNNEIDALTRARTHPKYKQVLHSYKIARSDKTFKIAVRMSNVPIVRYGTFRTK